MAPGCSGSDSEEEERHDRFKSERNANNSVKPLFRSLPSSLDSYTSRSRSPLRSNSSRNDKRRSKNFDESLSRRDRSRERKRSRERRSPRERERNGGSSDDKKSKTRLSNEKEKYESDSRKHCKEKDEMLYKTLKDRDHKHKHHERKRRSKENERDLDLDVVRLESRSGSIIETSSKFERYSSNSDSDYPKEDEVVDDKDDEIVVPTLPRYYEIVDENVDDVEGKTHLKPTSEVKKESSKKHKRSRDKSQGHRESKKRKKEKKHKRKHDKRKSEDSSSSDAKLPEENAQEVPDTSLSEKDSGEKINIDNTINSKESFSEHEEGEISGSEPEQYFGPALPPGKVAEERLVGPSLPAEEEQYGPALPPTVSSKEAMEEDPTDEDIIGPLPAGKESLAQAALDIRASLLKNQMDNKTETQVVRREEWMTELPEAKRAHLGLGPRKFRSNAAPDMTDRSSWTDTPKDKERKNLLGVEDELDTKKLEIAEKNKEMDLLAKKTEKKEKSLLAMHQKELKKKKKKEEKERGDELPERRPFSRELDLQSNKFDEAQKRSIIKKAQLLDSRFSTGESKYL